MFDYETHVHGRTEENTRLKLLRAEHSVLLAYDLEPQCTRMHSDVMNANVN